MSPAQREAQRDDPQKQNHRTVLSPTGGAGRRPSTEKAAWASLREDSQPEPTSVQAQTPNRSNKRKFHFRSKFYPKASPGTNPLIGHPGHTDSLRQSDICPLHSASLCHDFLSSKGTAHYVISRFTRFTLNHVETRRHRREHGTATSRNSGWAGTMREVPPRSRSTPGP